MKEENELIAKFMGEVNPFKDHSILPFQYHSSWDWLMPVYKKCYDIWVTNHLTEETCGEIFENIWLHLWKAEIDGVYDEIVYFIKWYNEK
jgi:hypothetical protein